VAVYSIYASIIPSYKYNLVLKSFSYGTQVMGHPVQVSSAARGNFNFSLYLFCGVTGQDRSFNFFLFAAIIFGHPHRTVI
jgi:hypothetical protein